MNSTGDGAVLVIDDSDVARAQMVDLLRQAGMHVIDLPSAIGATRAIIDGKVSVVVVDLHMPGMRGDRFAALFRNNPRLGEPGIVLVSGEDEATLRSIAKVVGADDVVPKARLKDLATVVSRLRARRDRGAGQP